MAPQSRSSRKGPASRRRTEEIVQATGAAQDEPQGSTASAGIEPDTDRSIRSAASRTRDFFETLAFGGGAPAEPADEPDPEVVAADASVDAAGEPAILADTVDRHVDTSLFDSWRTPTGAVLVPPTPEAYAAARAALAREKAANPFIGPSYLDDEEETPDAAPIQFVASPVAIPRIAPAPERERTPRRRRSALLILLPAVLIGLLCLGGLAAVVGSSLDSGRSGLPIAGNESPDGAPSDGGRGAGERSGPPHSQAAGTHAPGATATTKRPTGSPTPTPRRTGPAAATPAPTVRPTPAPTMRPTPAPTPRPTPTPTPRPTPAPTPRPTPTPTPAMSVTWSKPAAVNHGTAPTLTFRTLPGSRCTLQRTGSGGTRSYWNTVTANGSGYVTVSDWGRQWTAGTYTITANCTAPDSRRASASTTVTIR